MELESGNRSVVQTISLLCLVCLGIKAKTAAIN